MRQRPLTPEPASRSRCSRPCTAPCRPAPHRRCTGPDHSSRRVRRSRRCSGPTRLPPRRPVGARVRGPLPSSSPPHAPSASAAAAISPITCAVRVVDRPMLGTTVPEANGIDYRDDSCRCTARVVLPEAISRHTLTARTRSAPPAPPLLAGSQRHAKVGRGRDRRDRDRDADRRARSGFEREHRGHAGNESDQHSRVVGLREPAETARTQHQRRRAGTQRRRAKTSSGLRLRRPPPARASTSRMRAARAVRAVRPVRRTPSTAAAGRG